MGFLERAIRRGVSDAVGNAVGNAIGGAVRDAVTPVAEKYANQTAQRIDEAANATSQAYQTAANEVNQANQAAQSTQSGNLEGAFANLQRSLEGYATEAAKNMKTCPSCGETTTADKKFCPKCGTKLPEQTLAQGSVCPSCGKQNTIGTKFCSDCGAKLPAALAEEQAALDKNTSVLAQWDTRLPQYPKWTLGGTYELLCEDGYTEFTAIFTNDYAAENAVSQYTEILKQNGFREAGQYPSRDSLYKKVDGVCYHVDLEHCFDGGRERACIYFMIKEPEGGFDYVKPEQPQKKSGLFDLFK